MPASKEVPEVKVIRCIEAETFLRVNIIYKNSLHLTVQYIKITPSNLLKRTRGLPAVYK